MASKLEWTQPDPTIPFNKGFLWAASYQKELDYGKFGRVWGVSTLHIWVRFSVHERVEKTPRYQLVVSGLSGSINGHVYVDSVEDAKTIAQDILDYFFAE